MSVLIRGLLGTNVVVRGFLEGVDVAVLPGPGPATDVIVVYGDPVLSLVEGVEFTPTVFTGWEVGVGVLAWAALLRREARMVFAEQIDPQLLAAGDGLSGVVAVEAGGLTRLVQVLGSVALRGAEAPLRGAELEWGVTHVPEVSGTQADRAAKLYAGRVLSSQG